MDASVLSKAGNTVVLPRDTNQVRGLAQYAIDMYGAGRSFDEGVAPEVWERLRLFHTDSVLCGASALALRTNAPTVLRNEALRYPVHGGAAFVFGSTKGVAPEKAVLANCAAVREWDSNGTLFGYNPGRDNRAGEFGHNDYYPVAIAGAIRHHGDGAHALRAMLLIDEIRSSLAECFSLKSYYIDHVLHGAIASAIVYGAMTTGSVDVIESAVGMLCAHFVPYRAIRAGHQLSDSKGASAAFSSEAALMCVHRAQNGFIGPADIFRNPEAVFRLNEGPDQKLQRVNSGKWPNSEKANASPFDLTLACSGSDWGIMGMHFKLGLYEHQSAGALEAMHRLLLANPDLLEKRDGSMFKKILIRAYQPAFGIIGDPHKRNPTTRQSADHSMVYIIATLVRKALELQTAGWEELMLMPVDYDDDALNNPLTRALMEKIDFEHGGKEYDDAYPDGIPTSVVIESSDGITHDSGMVLHPGGHARNATGMTPVRLDEALAHKFSLLGALAVEDPQRLIAHLDSISEMSVDELRTIYAFAIKGYSG